MVLKGRIIREFANLWLDVDIGDGNVQIFRLSEFDIPKMFGGSLERKEELLEQGYELRPRFSCCGCMFFALEGMNTDLSCWACHIDKVDHKPCGIISKETLKRYYSDKIKKNRKEIRKYLSKNKREEDNVSSGRKKINGLDLTDG